MKRFFGSSTVMALCSLGLAFPTAAKAEPGWVYQNAPIAALMDGLYDGTTSCGDLLKQGDSIGLGTFDHLDGEMILLEGAVIAARQSGKVEQLSSCLTPFATVASYPADSKLAKISDLDFAGLEKDIDQRVPSRNEILMFKLSGEFRSVTVRVAPRQEKPYLKLVEAVKRQPVFKREKVKGSIVGFRFPDFVAGINVPGFHLHFVSDDRLTAGHVFQLELARGDLKYAEARGLKLGMPSDPAFRAATLTPYSNDEVSKVERQRK